MLITVNGKQEVLTDDMTLLEYLTYKGLKLDGVVVEYNGGILKQEQWEDITLNEKDALEIVSFVGGG